MNAMDVAGDGRLDVLDGCHQAAHVLGAVLVGAGDGTCDGVDDHQRDRGAFCRGGGDGGADQLGELFRVGEVDAGRQQAERQVHAVHAVMAQPGAHTAPHAAHALAGHVEHAALLHLVAEPWRATGDVQRPGNQQERLQARRRTVGDAEAVCGDDVLDEPFHRRHVGQRGDIERGEYIRRGSVRRRSIRRLFVSRNVARRRAGGGRCHGRHARNGPGLHAAQGISYLGHHLVGAAAGARQVDLAAVLRPYLGEQLIGRGRATQAVTKGAQHGEDGVAHVGLAPIRDNAGGQPQRPWVQGVDDSGGLVGTGARGAAAERYHPIRRGGDSDVFGVGVGIPFVTAAKPVHRRMGNDEAAITAYIHAGQYVLLGRHRSAGVLNDDVDAAARGEGIRRDGEDAMLALQPRQQFLSDLTVEIQNKDTADRASDDADSVTANGKPIMQLRGGGALALIRCPWDSG